MTKKHDELVEEIYELVYEPFFDLALTKHSRLYQDGATMYERAEDAITLVLSAVRDGLVDEELGVLGRESVQTIVDPWLDEMILMGATDFIALRKEEG